MNQENAPHLPARRILANLVTVARFNEAEDLVDHPLPSSATLQRIRAVRILESLGTEHGVTLLEEVTRRWAGLREGSEAAAALGRVLKQRRRTDGPFLLDPFLGRALKKSAGRQASFQH